VRLQGTLGGPDARPKGIGIPTRRVAAVARGRLACGVVGWRRIDRSTAGKWDILDYTTVVTQPLAFFSCIPKNFLGGAVDRKYLQHKAAQLKNGQEAQVMPEVELRHGGPLRPNEYHSLVPVKPAAASHQLGWAGLEAARFSDLAAAAFERPALTHHTLILFTRTPDELDLHYEGVKRHRPPPCGSVSILPAGVTSRVSWRGFKASFHVFLEPWLIARVAAEAFGLDPARWVVPPLDALDLPRLRTVMSAVDAELASGGAGGPLAAESLANVLAVHLLRHLAAPGRLERGRDGELPRGRLRAVIEYIEEHLDGSPSLAEMAAVVGLSPYHFARQFSAATGLPPHQFVIARRVERAKQLLQARAALPLAEVSALAGFSDQSQLTRHFKRLVGATPGQFRMSARTA
jgi:AraC family transcriptional regulator